MHECGRIPQYLNPQNSVLSLEVQLLAIRKCGFKKLKKKKRKPILVKKKTNWIILNFVHVQFRTKSIIIRCSFGILQHCFALSLFHKGCFKFMCKVIGMLLKIIVISSVLHSVHDSKLDYCCVCVCIGFNYLFIIPNTTAIVMVRMTPLTGLLSRH